MTTLTLELPDGAFSALRRSPQEFVKEMRIAAAVRWYAQQQMSQENAAEIAGLSRTEFLDELLRRRVPACQVTLEERRTLQIVKLNRNLHAAISRRISGWSSATRMSVFAAPLASRALLPLL